MDNNRRNFLKKMGMISFALSTGFINDSAIASYTKRSVGEQKLETCFTYKEESNRLKTLLVTTGDEGLCVAEMLNQKYKSPYKKTVDHISIVHFDSQKKNLDKLLSKHHIVFLAGSILERDFWIAKDLLSGVDNNLFHPLISSSELNHIELSENSHLETKSVIQIPQRNYADSASNTILAIVSVIQQQLIGTDFSDVKSVLGKKNHLVMHFESSWNNIENILKNEFQNKKFPSGVFVSFQFRDYDFTLNILENLIDLIYSSFQEDEEFFWSNSCLSTINTDVRITVIANAPDYHRKL